MQRRTIYMYTYIDFFWIFFDTTHNQKYKKANKTPALETFIDIKINICQYNTQNYTYTKNTDQFLLWYTNWYSNHYFLFFT